MSQVHFVVYALDTGAVRRAGTCQDYDLQLQAGPGEGVMEATADAVIVAEVNLTPVRASAATRVDAEAEAVRGKFITSAPGQIGTYLNKQREAESYLADDTSATPYLTAEATATGTTVAALAAVVHATALAWLSVDVQIEATRRGAKVAIENATTVGEIAAAAAIDWSAFG